MLAALIKRNVENVLQATDQDKLAKFKYLCKFTAHRVFEMLGLRLRHLSTREVKHLLTVFTPQHRWLTAAQRNFQRRQST